MRLERAEQQRLANLTVRVICENRCIPTKAIFVHNPAKRFAFPRQIVMYLLNTICQLSQAEIASVLDRHPHTAAHAIRCIEKRILASDTFATYIGEMRQKILGG